MNPPDYLTLRSLAFALDAHVGRLPCADDPDREPHLPDLTEQIRDLTVLVGRMAETLGGMHRLGPQGDGRIWRDTTQALAVSLRRAGIGIADLSATALVWQKIVHDAQYVGPLDASECADAYENVAVQLGGARESLTVSATTLHRAARDLARSSAGRSDVARARTRTVPAMPTWPGPDSPAAPPPHSAPGTAPTR
jgi:hypothetical protein